MIPQTAYDSVRRFVLALEEHELKPCITLVRYGITPTPSVQALWSKLPQSLLKKLFVTPIELAQPSESGEIFFNVSNNPLISSTIISLALSVRPSANQVIQAYRDSVSKEVKVMEGLSAPAKINWNCFFDPIPGQCYVLPHQQHDCTPQVLEIHSAFHRFREKIRYSRIWPYGTTRGISRSAELSAIRLRELSKTKIGLVNDIGGLCSLDLVRLYIHEGVWSSGVCELKQRWYASGLTPRTYFAQGGDAIRVSSYLRSFFNDFTDTFLPTERYSRVDGSRLTCPDGGYFFIYDLTSFTSNFHEQESFLRSMATFFRETTVFLIGPHLSLIESSVGDLIDEYCDVVNHLPPYEFNKGILDFGLDALHFFHHVAGFLGVPGNLASCTLAHGIAIGVNLTSTSHQSTAGDDGNVGVTEQTEPAIVKTVRALGLFNREKGSSTQLTPHGSYLKRRFEQVGNQGKMTERVDYPLLGAVNSFVTRDPRFPKLSENRSQIRRSMASSCAKVFRDIFRLSGGQAETGVFDYALAFLSDVYSKVQLPTSGMVRKMYGSDSDRETKRVDAAVVFPLSMRYLKRDPDVVLCEEFLPWFIEVPVGTDEIVSFPEGKGWFVGEKVRGRSSRALEQLVRLGFIEKAETERIVVYGVEARDYFRRIVSEDFREQEFEYTPLFDLSPLQLQSIGLSGYDELSWKRQFKTSSAFTTSNFSFRRKYADLDRPNETFPSDLHALASLDY